MFSFLFKIQLMKYILLPLIAIVFFSCSNRKEQKITQSEDYNVYLKSETNAKLQKALNNKEFWSKRIGEDTSKITGVTELASVYSSIFSATGDVEQLNISEQLYTKAKKLSAKNKDAYLRSLAHTYISQHRFKEAKKLLDSAYTYKDNRYETELMLFDVTMELGLYKEANSYLKKIKNNSDFNYLIRLSKWSDYQGNLDEAIKYMEKAMQIAESSGKKQLKVWSYSNLADFYGHAGRINDAYNYYLKTLKLDSDNAYAKKGIAWIAYSYENDTKEANRILDSILKQHKSPDYYLLKAEIAEHKNEIKNVEKFQKQFMSSVTENNYGAMYNTYLIELYAETAPQKALSIANKEVANRATPETYSLLALAQLKAGQNEEALHTITTYVEGKTFEPMAQYYSALVYKANGENDKIKPIKEELEGASFEIGPVLTKKVAEL